MNDVDYELYDAVRFGDILDIQNAIGKGAKLHSYDEAALRLAAEYNRKENVEYLLGRGADPLRILKWIPSCAATHSLLELSIQQQPYRQQKELINYAISAAPPGHIRQLLQGGVEFHKTFEETFQRPFNSIYLEAI